MRNIFITEQFCPACLYKQDRSILFSVERRKHAVRAADRQSE